MIYLDTLTVIPKVKIGTPTAIKLINQVTKEETILDTIADSGIYYTLTFNEELSDGQYDYYVLAGDSILASGIAQKGIYTKPISDYSTNITIKTYK